VTNFDLHERAQQLADTASAYELARRLVEAEQDRDQLRGCFHSACEELTALKAALVDEGDEVPTGPALSLVEDLKADRDALQRLANCRAEQRDALVTQSERLNKQLQSAIYRLEDMLEGDDGQAWDEAEKALPAMKKALEEDPAVSLASRDAEQQAAAIDKWSATIIQLMEWVSAKHAEDPSWPPISLQMIRELCCDMDRDAESLRQKAKAAP